MDIGDSMVGWDGWVRKVGTLGLRLILWEVFLEPEFQVLLTNPQRRLEGVNYNPTNILGVPRPYCMLGLMMNKAWIMYNSCLIILLKHKSRWFTCKCWQLPTWYFFQKFPIFFVFEPKSQEVLLGRKRWPVNCLRQHVESLKIWNTTGTELKTSLSYYYCFQGIFFFFRFQELYLEKISSNIKDTK